MKALSSALPKHELNSLRVYNIIYINLHQGLPLVLSSHLPVADWSVRDASAEEDEMHIYTQLK